MAPEAARWATGCVHRRAKSRSHQHPGGIATHGAIRYDHVHFHVTDMRPMAEEQTAAYGSTGLLVKPSGGMAARSVVLGQASMVSLTERRSDAH